MANSIGVLEVTDLKERYSFRAGWDRLSGDKKKKVKKQLMEAMGVDSKAAFYHRMNGKTIPSAPEAEEIERIFKANGVKEMWGSSIL